MAQTKRTDQAAQNKELLRRFHQAVFNAHDWRVETLAQYLTPDFVDHTAGLDAEPGLEGLSRRYATWHAAFGEARKESIAVLSEEDRLAVLYEIHARHTGPFMDIQPSGKSVVIPGLEIYRVRDGKLSDYWSIYDYLNTAAEIGARLALVPVDEAFDANVRGQEVYRGITHGERKPHHVFVTEATDREVAANRATLLGFQQEVFNGHDWRVETLARHLTPDFVDHAAGPWDKAGLEGVSERFDAWQSAFTNAAEENIAMVGENDMMAVLYDLHAEHRGPFLDVPATNRHVIIPGIEMLRFRDGKIAEHWGIYDFMSTARQLGTTLVFVPGDQPARPEMPEQPARTTEVGHIQSDEEVAPFGS